MNKPNSRGVPFGRSPFSLACCAALSLSTPQIVHAQDATESEAANAPTQLEEIVVTANPLGRTSDELVQPVEVLSGAELDRKRRGTIGETLENEAGVATTDFGTGAARPVIRGLAGPRVEILDNGLSTMDVSDLSPDHAVSIDTAHATQIEILKGPSTLLYGNAASGGAVNIKDDRLPDEVSLGLHGSVDGEYGSNGDAGRSHTEIDYGFGQHQLHADFGWRESGAYEIPDTAHADGDGATGTLPNSFTRNKSGAASYSFIGDDGNVFGLSYSRYESKYGLAFGHHHEEEEGEEHEDEEHEEEAPVGFIELKQNRYDGRALLDRPFAGLESLTLRAGYSDYTHTEFEAPGEPGTVFNNKQVQGRIEAVHIPVAGLRGVVGLQLSNRDFEALGDEAYVPPVTSKSLGLFIVEELATSFGQIEFGGRVERNQNDPDGNVSRDFTPLSLSLGARYDLGEETHLKLYLTQSERSPVPEELYAFGPHAATATFERGSLDIDKETFRNIELGFDHHVGRFALDASIYYNMAKDYIYLSEVDEGLNADGSGTASSDGVADRVNDEGEFAADGEFLLVDYRQADATLWGYELQLGYALIPTGPVQLNLRLFTDAVRAELDDGGNLPRITPDRYGIGFDAHSGRTDFSMDFTRVSQQDRIAAFETETDGYNLLSANVNVLVFGAADHGPHAEIYLRGSNLLDEDIRRATSFVKDEVPAPGRSGFLGVRYTF